MGNNEEGYRVAANADELFAKVASAEKTAASSSSDEDSLGVALSLHEQCMSIMFESTVIDLTTEQRAELNTRLDQIDAQLQQRAMSAFMG